MPNFFSFTPGTEWSNPATVSDASSPLLGRFRAVPRSSHAVSRSRSRGFLRPHSSSIHVGYGALIAAELEAETRSGRTSSDAVVFDDDDDGDRGLRERLGLGVKKAWVWTVDLWVTPKQSTVKRVVERWWSRWAFLVILPAVLAVAWCAIPFPQYGLADAEHPHHPDHDPNEPPTKDRKTPGHGEARVRVNFWFFLFVYYGFYNLTALIWITKVFNLYSLNWWPRSLGFPVTMSLIAIVSLAGPIPFYLCRQTKWLTVHNTVWITWTFVIMAIPVATAFLILMTNERHQGLRHHLSETQRIFTTSWWTGEPDTMPRRERRRGGLDRNAFDPDAALSIMDQPTSGSVPVSLRRRWLPASFVRFVWFCLALAVGLLAYVIGEAYAEIYLRTLPHNNLETIVYVYGWILTVYLLDGLTGWILGGNAGERVGSYPLSWIFKLYFMLTYQTYVRALYARLRSPNQFMVLQALSSSILIILTPLMMSPLAHRLLTLLSLNSQSYGTYQKLCIRNVFVRFLAENCSMLAFLGSILVLHFGANKDVYPYFAFDDPSEQYNFRLTFIASSTTWACELLASVVVARLIRYFYGVGVVTEGKLDLAVWPELLPTSVAVVLHVLQNMLFSIIRLHFR